MRIQRIILLLSCIFVRTWTRSLEELPHCSRNTVLEGEMADYDDMGGHKKILSTTQVTMALHETTCFILKVNDSETVMHTIELLRLEQHHPVTASYTFGIPRVFPTCKCDCAGGEQICNLDEYNYKNCTSGAVCFKTYHPLQSNVGCVGSGKSDLCCQLKIDPYKGWTFTALQLNQPDTVLVLKYRIFERLGNWRGVSLDEIQVPLNKGLAKFEFTSRHRIAVAVSGSRPNREIIPGMYFIREGTREVREGVAVNEPSMNNLEKLGWLRQVNGKWEVPKGLAKIRQAHHVSVEDCKAQRYTSTLIADQLVIVSQNEQEDENFNLGKPLSDNPWIDTATYTERVVKVEHAEGSSITLQLTTETRPKLMHKTSQFDTFSGTIRLDRNSNRLFNVTFFGAKGTMIGRIYSSPSKEKILMVFSVQVDNSIVKDYTTVISVPSSVDGSRYVCFYPSGDMEAEQCKLIPFEAQSLSSFFIADSWQNRQGDCSGCNERGVDSFMAYVDPRTWFNGINSPQEMLVVCVEVVVGAVLVLFTVLLCTKCFIPLARCSFSVARPHKK